MHFKYKKNMFTIACVFCVLTTNNVQCYKIKTETSSLITQYQENISSTKERRLNATKNDNLFDTPENNMKKLLYDTPPFYLNAAITKEKCRTTLCFRNNKLYHTINTLEKLNTIFLKTHRFYNKNLYRVSLRKRSVSENYTHDENIDKTNKEEVKDKKIRFSNISIIATTRSSILEFPDAPPRHVIKVLEFNQENEYFGVFSDLMAYLQPNSFPLDFLKDVMRNHMPIHLIIYKAIKIEGRVLAWLFMWLILSLALPCAVIAQSCCTAKGMERLHDNYSISSDQYRNTKLKIIAIVMHILLMLLFKLNDDDGATGIFPEYTYM